jgi:hypothetical protein
MSRRLIVATGASAVVLLSATPALAAWSTSGSGSATATGLTLAAPTGVTITGCTASDKTIAAQISGTVTLTWTRSTSSLVTGSQTLSIDGVANTTVSATTTTTTLNYVKLAAGPHQVEVQGMSGSNWKTAAAASGNTFTLATSGPNGSCNVP